MRVSWVYRALGSELPSGGPGGDGLSPVVCRLSPVVCRAGCCSRRDARNSLSPPQHEKRTHVNVGHSTRVATRQRLWQPRVQNAFGSLLVARTVAVCPLVSHPARAKCRALHSRHAGSGSRDSWKLSIRLLGTLFQSFSVIC